MRKSKIWVKREIVSNLNKIFIFIYGIFSVIIIVAILFFYSSQVNFIKNKISKEYENLYIENAKLHIKDFILHISSEIEKKRNELFERINYELKKQTQFVYDEINKIYIILKMEGVSNEKIKKHILNIFKKRNFGIYRKIVTNVEEVENNDNLIKGDFTFIKKFQKLNLLIISKANFKEYEKNLEEYILKNLDKFRYGIKKTGYIFVVKLVKKNGKLKAIRLVNPNKPRYEIGKEIPINITDTEGKKFFKEMIDKCFKYGQGFVRYKFKIPGTNRIGKKISFVKYIKDWNWIIGTGFYLDIFSQQLNEKDRRLENFLNKSKYKFLLSVIFFQLFLFFIFVFIIKYFTNKTQKYIKKIEEKEKFQKTLIDLLPNPLFVIDKDGKLIEFNLSFEKFFNISKERLKEGEIFEVELLKRIMKADLILERDKKLNGKNRYITEIDLHNGKGNIRRVEIFKSFLYQENELIGLIGIIFDITEQVKIKEELYKQTIKDELTGAFNRRYFSQIFYIEKERAIRNKYRNSLIMFDIDFFKKINDNYGHQTGDYVLKTLVSLIKRNIRKYDYLFRVGGEEFVILLINANKENAYKIAEKLRKLVEDYKFDDRFKVTISLGVTEIREDDTLESVMKRVDKVLYEAKNSGRNKTVLA